MGQVVPADVPFPDVLPTPFIDTHEGVVFFTNFGIGSAEPVVPFHTDFIAQRLVPFLIAQIDQLGFTDRFMTVRLFGLASATGTAARNLALSQQRAQKIGEAISKEFDKQKSKSKTAGRMQTIVDAHGEGDEAGRSVLALITKTLGHAPTSAQIEAAEFKFRSVKMRAQVRHLVVDDDTKVACRQMFSVSFDTKKVPANLLEQKLDELGPILKAILGFAVNKIIDLLESFVQKVLEALDVAAPEISILFKFIDFITPNDIEEAFQFRDSRGRTAIYRFAGSEHKKSVTLDALASLMSVIRWARKLSETLDKFLPRLNSPELVALNQQLKQVVANEFESFVSMFRKGGSMRRVIGDLACDILLQVLEEGGGKPLTFDASDFFPCIFDKPGVFNVSTFNGPARTETRELLLKSNIRLDFLGEGPEGRLGFHGTTRIENKVSPNAGFVGFGISAGFLQVQPLIVR